jgi:hypothetical protein
VPDPTFAKLYDATTALRPAPIEQVRARGRQRARRQRLAVVAAAVVAVAVIAGGVGIANRNAAGPNPPGNSPSATPPTTASPTTAAPTPSTTPSATPVLPTSIPVSAMLQVADLPGSGWRANDNLESPGDWHFEYTLGYCPATRGRGGPGDARADRLRGLSRPGTEIGMVQEMWLYRDSAGAQARFEWYRSGAAACARHTSIGGGTVVTVTIVRLDIGNAEAMLIKTSSEYGVGLYGFVVNGPLVTQFTAYDDNEATGRSLAVKAHTRMCAALNSC